MISPQEALRLTPPSTWRVVPFWSLFRRTKSIGHADEELLSVYRDHGVVPTSSRDDNHNKPSEDLSGYQLVTEGALVTNKMKAWQGSIAISRHRGIVSPAYYVYQPLSEEHDQFLHYLLRSEPYIALYQRISKGVRVSQWDLEHEALRTIPIVLPDLATQKRIADFLDAETARIDALIEKKLGLLSATERLRSSSIDRAISGEYVDASRTETGNTWFPTIPAGWRLARLKHLVNSISDGPHISPEYVDSGVPFISARNIKVDRWSLEDAKFISEDLFKELSRKIRPTKGDVLYTKGGTTGVARYVDLDFDFQIWVHVALLKVRLSVVVPQFVATALNSLGCYEQSQLFTRGATNSDLGLNRMANIWLPLPPIEEQLVIVERLTRLRTH